MNFNWCYKKKTPQKIKFFLKEQGVSKNLLAKIKFQGGRIEVNGESKNALYELVFDDQIQITIPDEKEHETLLCDHQPIEIVFEDAHFLIVEKPAGIPSIPAQYHPNGTMANRVKAYYKNRGYRDQVVHVITRLDRDTSGLMLFAKHGFAHAMLDQELRKKRVVKLYQALVSGELEKLAVHDTICLPIGRDTSSILKRKVREDGQFAETEYWVEQFKKDKGLLRIQLHTGRTHQIRVHFEALGCPLLGDEMYHGDLDQGITRQALHCCKLVFTHPFTKEVIELTSSLPKDMQRVID